MKQLFLSVTRARNGYNLLYILCYETYVEITQCTYYAVMLVLELYEMTQCTYYVHIMLSC